MDHMRTRRKPPARRVGCLSKRYVKAGELESNSLGILGLFRLASVRAGGESRTIARTGFAHHWPAIRGKAPCEPL